MSVGRHEKFFSLGLVSICQTTHNWGGCSPHPNAGLAAVACRAMGYAFFGCSQGAVMGFLDDLKRQAADVQARQTNDSASAERQTALVESAAQTAARYFVELVSQLDVLKPVARGRYQFDNRTQFSGLAYSGFASDQRKRRAGDMQITDYIECRAWLRTGRRVQLAKNFVNEIERVESALRLAGISCTPEAVRNPDNGRLIEMRYDFVADVLVGVRIEPLHSRGQLRFVVRNFDGLESVEGELSPVQLTQQRLDELAKWWVGQPHQFLDGAQNLRRLEPR